MRVSFLLPCVAWFAFSHLLAADPIEDLKSFSSLEEIDVQKLADGDILVGALPATAPRIISTESCFILMAPPGAAADFLKAWNASHHEELKVYAHQTIQTPSSDSDFEALNLNSSEDLFHGFVYKTQKTRPDQSEFYLSLKEMADVSESMKSDAEPGKPASQCWKNILKTRTVQFQKKGTPGIAPYESRSSVINAASETEHLLDSAPKISKRFASLLSATVLSKHPPTPSFQPQYYWEMLEINSHLNIDLGVIFSDFSDHRWQMLDCLYYASRDIFASLTLRQLWPIKVNNQDATLVWQGDFASTGALENARGVERMGAASLMKQEIKEQIRFLREDLAKSH